MNLNEIIEVVGGVNYNNCDLNKYFKEIKIDSRILNKDDIFICLKGDRFDGHDFINEAINKEVSAIIISNDISIKTSIPLIKVNDTYSCLGLIASYYRIKYKPKVIGITGSNGKTTTKELISNILQTKYNVLKNEGNKNNIVGLSTTLFNLNKNIDFAVVEMGMNHRNEISRLSKICKPDVAIITNIGTSHIGNLKSKKNIFLSKLEIRDGMSSSNLIVNGDDKYLKKIKNSYKCGINYKSDLIAYNIYSNSDILSFNIFIDKEYQIKFNYPVLHFITDILLAIRIGLMFDVDINNIIDVIYNYKMIDNRMNILKIENNTLINDCYNSSYESLIGTLKYLNNIDNNKIVIFGDILELGNYSKKIHKKINKYIKKMYNTVVLTVGNYTKYIKGIHFDNNKDLSNYLISLNLNNYYIYIKGSHNMKLEEVVKQFIHK